MQWCSCCGDLCLLTRPIEIKYHDGIIVKKNICIECFDGDEELTIKLKRNHMVGNITSRLSNLGKK